MGQEVILPFCPRQDDNLDKTTYIWLKLEKNYAQIKDLAPATAYLFRVQVLSSDGSHGGFSQEEQFETLSEGKMENTYVVLTSVFRVRISMECLCYCF